MENNLKVELKEDGELFCKLEAVSEKEYIYVSWHGFINEDKTKRGMLAEIEMIQKTGYKKILNNNRFLNGPYPIGIEKWIGEVWVPKAIEEGFKWAATLVSEQIFSKFSAEQLEQKLEGITYRNFGNEESAVRWLLEAE